jgi:hypothetical protein
MKNNDMFQMIVVRFHYLVMAFALGALCVHISHFGWTLNVLLVASVVAVGAVVNIIIFGGYLHGNNHTPANV